MVVAVGVAVGGVTLNLIILVSISAVGLTLATYIDKSNQPKRHAGLHKLQKSFNRDKRLS